LAALLLAACRPTGRCLPLPDPVATLDSMAVPRGLEGSCSSAIAASPRDGQHSTDVYSDRNVTEWSRPRQASENALTPEGVERPASGLRPGGPGSFLMLGREGRTFVAGGPSVAEISECVLVLQGVMDRISWTCSSRNSMISAREIV
jgi:hypothetical protein